MVSLSEAQLARSRKNETGILRAVSLTKQTTIAKALGLDESTISRLLNDGTIERFSQMLAVVGMKVIPESMRCYEDKSIEALLTLAKERLAQIEQPQQLAWDE